MKLKTFSLLAVFGLLGVSEIRAGEPRVEVKPEGSTGEIALVNAGKIRNYYPLSPKKSSVILVKGPGELRVLTRARFTARTKGLLNYRINYTIDGGEAHMLDVEGAKRSGEASFRDETLGIPGDSHDLSLRLGRGYHSVELTVLDTVPKVTARFLYTPGKDVKVKWVALAPQEPYHPVDLLTKESTTHYFRFSMKEPLKVSVIGPTDLRILTRVENKYNMDGVANYRVQIRLFGQVAHTYQLSSKRSESTTYKDSTNTVPGKARELVYKVEKGKQLLEIVPLEDVSLLGYMLIPEKDVDLEE